MAFELTSIDTALASAVQIDIVPEPATVSGFPQGPGGGSGLVKLQFPPRIVSDTKSADWKEDPKFSYEPIVLFQGSAPRKITMELVYIVDGQQFTAQTIANITKKIKAYFYRTIKGGSKIPIVKIRFYAHVGQVVPADFRLLDVNITHGDTIIKDKDGVFPLLTKITINAALTTQAGPPGKQNVGNLQAKPPVDWY